MPRLVDRPVASVQQQHQLGVRVGQQRGLERRALPILPSRQPIREAHEINGDAGGLLTPRGSKVPRVGGGGLHTAWLALASALTMEKIGWRV